MPHGRLPQVALSLGRVSGECLDATRLHHHRAAETWKLCVDRIRRVPLVRLLPGSTTATRRDLQHRRSNAETQRRPSRCAVRFETRRPRHHHGIHRAYSNPGRLIFSPPLLSRDAAPPWMYVSISPVLQKPEETLRRRHLIANCPPGHSQSTSCLDGGRVITPHPVQQTSLPAGMASRCRRNRFSAD